MVKEASAEFKDMVSIGALVKGFSGAGVLADIQWSHQKNELVGRTADQKLTALWRNSPVKQRRVRGQELEGHVDLRTCRGYERE